MEFRSFTLHREAVEGGDGLEAGEASLHTREQASPVSRVTHDADTSPASPASRVTRDEAGASPSALTPAELALLETSEACVRSGDDALDRGSASPVPSGHPALSLGATLPHPATMPAEVPARKGCQGRQKGEPGVRLLLMPTYVLLGRVRQQH